MKIERDDLYSLGNYDLPPKDMYLTKVPALRISLSQISNSS